MKKLVTVTVLILAMASLSQAKIPVQDAHATGSHKPMLGRIPIAIRNELARPAVKLPPKPKLLRSNPFRFTAIRLADADPWAVPDDEDIMVDRNRLTVVKTRCWDPDLDISDHAKVRLAIARARAMQRYRETWT